MNHLEISGKHIKSRPEAVIDVIRCGDYQDLLPTVPDNSVDLLLTDPPYNISTEFEVQFQDRKDISHSFGEWDQEQVLPSDWIPEINQVLKPAGTLVAFYDNRSIHRVIEAAQSSGLELRQKLYWHKQNPTPQVHGVKWQEAVEEAVIATANQGEGHHFQNQRGQRHNVVETPICSGEERRNHPTQKPKSLFRPVVKWWTQPGDLVLDPFTGTGSVCIAAQELGRRYIGFEKQQKHAETARKRLKQKSLHTF